MEEEYGFARTKSVSEFTDDEKELINDIDSKFKAVDDRLVFSSHQARLAFVKARVLEGLALAYGKVSVQETQKTADAEDTTTDDEEESEEVVDSSTDNEKNTVKEVLDKIEAKEGPTYFVKYSNGVFYGFDRVDTYYFYSVDDDEWKKADVMTSNRFASLEGISALKDRLGL